MIKVCVEVQAGSRERHKFDERTLEHKEVRQAAEPYPYSYGFILGTNSADGDCVDCYIISYQPLKPGMVVECESIGLLEQNEGGEIDHKILAALPGEEVTLNDELLAELQRFIQTLFSRYPELHIRVGPILPREAAIRYIEAHSEG